jgi:leader peptidase (prepilin peptidase) / N-methyltransferase
MPLPIWFLLTFLFLLGAVVGSFLNVVIYRLPRGLSLVRPGSKCPNCDHPIRWYDNVPILGWSVLGGRCRDCGLAISVRYPLVELAIGLMFMAVGYADMIRPMQHADQLAAAQVAAANAGAVAGADQIKVPVVENQNLETGDYVWPVAFHILLLCALLAAVMIDVDGQRLPRQLITWPAAGGILLAMLRPTVQVFPLFHVQPAVTDSISLIPLATSFVGMLTAVVIRLATQRFVSVARARELGLWNGTLALYGVGAFLGWQAVLVVSVFAILWSLVGRLAPVQMVAMHVRPTAVVFLATLVWCLTERQLISGG